MADEFSEIQSVAVVGAGVSGVFAASHLLAQGLRVTLFERSSVAGGVWHCDERSMLDPPYPNAMPSLGAYISGVEAKSLGQLSDHHDLEVCHAPLGPCYAGLKTNVPLSLMKTTLGNWPEDLDDADFISQRHVEQYIQELTSAARVSEVAEYNTRVEEVTKMPLFLQWKIQTTTLTEPSSCESSARLLEKDWFFDVVIVASGHYNMPNIPDIPGLRVWKMGFPSKVSHSKQYRSPEVFRGRKKLLLIGASVSSNDIAKETEGIADKNFQSSRGGDQDHPEALLLLGATRVGGLKSFVLHDSELNKCAPNHDEPVPGNVELATGSRIFDIDHVVLATGYLTSFPFLPQHHNDTLPAEKAGPDILVTAEGNMVHNLHKDIFFIPDPTLAFVGTLYHNATFPLIDFQAQVAARVFSGLARLPSTQSMRDEYAQKVAQTGLGRNFHSLRGETEARPYAQALVDWMNRDIQNDAPRMVGYTESYIAGYRKQKEALRVTLAQRKEERGFGDIVWSR